MFEDGSAMLMGLLGWEVMVESNGLGWSLGWRLVVMVCVGRGCALSEVIHLAV
jgi:hypothetical protein